MTRRTATLALLSIPVLAQEGHPLTGTWSGDWGTPGGPRTHITLVLTWDGKNASGVLNPGPNSANIANVLLDVTNWTVRFETETKDGRVSAEGKLEDIGSIHRRITGAWRQGTTQGDFRVVRD